MLERVKLILALSDTSKDLILEEFISTFTQAVNLYCRTVTLPIQLEFVVVECTIARYNRLGSEGLKSENIDVIGLTYQEEIIAPYKPFMDAYKKTLNKVKLL